MAAVTLSFNVITSPDFAIAVASTLFVALPVWRKTDNKVKPLSLRAKLRRNKKDSKAKTKKNDGPEEYIFTGIND